MRERSIYIKEKLLYTKQETNIICASNVLAKRKYDQDMLMVQIITYRKILPKIEHIDFFFIFYFLKKSFKKINIFLAQLAWQKLKLETQTCIPSIFYFIWLLMLHNHISKVQNMRVTEETVGRCLAL